MSGVLNLFLEAMVESVAREEKRHRARGARGEVPLSFEEHLAKQRKRRLAMYGTTEKISGRERKRARKQAAKARRRGTRV